jgi:hypothetical protein
MKMTRSEFPIEKLSGSCFFGKNDIGLKGLPERFSA